MLMVLVTGKIFWIFRRLGAPNLFHFYVAIEDLEWAHLALQCGARGRLTTPTDEIHKTVVK